jgi:hypothetical protein
MMEQLDAEELATVLDQIAGHSSDADIRGHVRQVIDALRGDGVIILNGPPQQASRGAEWRRTWSDIPYTGGANGIGIDPPDGGGWQLVQSLHIPAAPAKKRDHQVLGSMVHVWYRPAGVI